MNHWADYVIFGGFILVSLGIGLYHALTGGRQRTTEEFIMADRKLKLIPTTLSVLMSYMSAILVIGQPAEIYSYGIMVVPMAILGFWVAIIITERLFIPWLYPLKLTSVNKYFQMRYADGEVRAFASLIGIINAVMYMGSCMFAPAVALETATGFPSLASIPVMAIVCVIYTSLGGMRAVIWTDVFQFFVMLAGMLAVLFKAMILVGGAKSAFSLLSENQRSDVFDFSFNPRVRQTIWAYIFGWGSQWASLYGLQQASVQRYSALPTLRISRCSALLNLLGVTVLVTIAGLSGVAVFAYYASIPCDPVLSGAMQSANQILPLFVKEIFVDAPGFSGMFLATLYSGALSSVSSSLSGAAANAWEDILRPRLPNVSEYKAAAINKMLVGVFGIIATGLSFMAAQMTGTITQIAIAFFGACGGPLLGMFLLGGIRCLQFVRSRAVLVGGMLGVSVCLWVAIASGYVKGTHPVAPYVSTVGCDSVMYNATEPVTPDIIGIDLFYSISYLWYAPLGVVITMVSASFISLIMNVTCRVERRIIPQKLFIPFRSCLSCKNDDSTSSKEQDTQQTSVFLQKL